MKCPCCGVAGNELKLDRAPGYVNCVRHHKFQLRSKDDGEREIVVVVSTDLGCNKGDVFPVPADAAFAARD